MKRLSERRRLTAAEFETCAGEFERSGRSRAATTPHRTGRGVVALPRRGRGEHAPEQLAGFLPKDMPVHTRPHTEIIALHAHSRRLTGDCRPPFASSGDRRHLLIARGRQRLVPRGRGEPRSRQCGWALLLLVRRRPCPAVRCRIGCGERRRRPRPCHRERRRHGVPDQLGSRHLARVNLKCRTCPGRGQIRDGVARRTRTGPGRWSRSSRWRAGRRGWGRRGPRAGRGRPSGPGPRSRCG